MNKKIRDAIYSMLKKCRKGTRLFHPVYHDLFLSAVTECGVSFLHNGILVYIDKKDIEQLRPTRSLKSWEDVIVEGGGLAFVCGTTNIVCPECGSPQQATILHFLDEPWPSYIHECNCCHHIIMEQEVVWNT